MGRPRGAPLRVLHCPAAVGGHPPALARAERALGLDSRTIVLERPPFGYDVDEVLFRRGDGRARREVARWRLLLRAARDFDVVHFNFGSTILPRSHPTRSGLASRLYDGYARAVELRDLGLLRRAGKRLFVTFQGDDARPSGDPELDRRKRGWIARFDRYVDGLYALNPDLLRVLPPRAEFLPYAAVDLDDWRPAATGRDGGVPVVVHAPSDRDVKGTSHVLAAVERLRAEGLELELVLAEGLPHARVREEYERADLVVDQLLSGWYGSVAVEAMALGKPVIARLEPDDLGPLPTGMRAELPILDASPETLPAVLREWLTERRAELPEAGRRGRAYVERWHDPRRIAARLKEAYEGAPR